MLLVTCAGREGDAVMLVLVGDDVPLVTCVGREGDAVMVPLTAVVTFADADAEMVAFKDTDGAPLWPGVVRVAIAVTLTEDKPVASA